MVAKPSTSWMLLTGGYHRIIYLVLLVWLLGPGGLAVNVQDPNAIALLLNQKESDVQKIAGNATSNNDDCGSLDGCSRACSRVVCYPVSGESPQCTTVGNNEFFHMCPSGACKNKILVDYNRSFVTLPAPASTNLSTEVARDICFQRQLDSTFKTVSFPSDYTLVYFGSASGSHRAFPGRENDGKGCNSFDPRKKPWYLNGVSVPKDVKILVDVSSSMGNLVTVDYKRPPEMTYLGVAKNITLELLQTFSPQDYVEVFSFDASSATSLAGAVQVVTPNIYVDSAGFPELGPLGASVGNLAVSTNAAPSNLNRAIVQAVKSFNTIDKLKVIIVLSDGHFVPLNRTTFPSLELQNLHIKLMVYKLPKNDDSEDPFLLKDPSFRENICSVNGSFERLNAIETVNALYSMRSYFTYLARTQLASVDNKATWSYPYVDFSQDRTVVTVTYPAFGSDGLLIGVAGLDFVLENLNQTLQDMVYADISNRTRGTQAPRYIPMPCNYQSTPAKSVCSSSTPADSSAICPGTNSTNTLALRTCCGDGTCGLPPARTKQWNILISLLAVPLFVGIAACFYFRFKAGRTESVPPAVDLLHFNLCEHFVHTIEDLVNNGVSLKRKSTQNLLNQRQCRDLSAKLSVTAGNIREILFQFTSSHDLFKPALEKLYLVLEMAKLLVTQCGEKDWCTASVFQSQNEIAFQEILLDVGLCYNVIYEQARSINCGERNLPEDLRQSSEVFVPAPKNAIRQDQVELQKRLEAALGNEQRVSVKQCLVKYLLMKLNHTFESPGASTLDTCNSLLWSKETELRGTWGNHSSFLGSGSGASGVCSTKWMGISCAKKVFHDDLIGSEQQFLKEASILAYLKHPCIVTFICCGNGELKGDRFIAMELMENSLSGLIVDQRSKCEYFSLPVVIDIMVQIARGMCYLHDQGIAHRDLKPQNVVVNTLKSPHLAHHFRVKLVDFGLSKTEVQASTSNSLSFPGVGTTTYRAPEVHPQAHPEGTRQTAVWFKADVFSFAMTCAHLLSLNKPIGDLKVCELYKKLMDGWRPELPRDCPEEIHALLRNCWETRPSSRPSFAKICTRLEAFRYKLLRGLPTSDSSLQEIEATEFIITKIEAHRKAFSQRPRDAMNNAKVENTDLPDFPTRGTNTAETSLEITRADAPGTSAVEMTQRSFRSQRSSSW